MFGKAMMKKLVAANCSELLLPVIGVVLCAALILFCSTSMAHAAIVWSGDVTPTNPATWTSSTTGYIGQSAMGTVTVNGGWSLMSSFSYLGYNSGSSGTVTVTGTGSKWTNSSTFYVGNSGSGTLNIEAGGQVNSGNGNLGYNSGSSGTVPAPARSGPTVANSASAALAAAPLTLAAIAVAEV